MKTVLICVGLLAIVFGLLAGLGARNAMNEITAAISVSGGFILIGLSGIIHAVEQSTGRLIKAMGLVDPDQTKSDPYT